MYERDKTWSYKYQINQQGLYTFIFDKTPFNINFADDNICSFCVWLSTLVIVCI